MTHKKLIVIGLTCIFIAFICVVGILYVLLGHQQVADQKVEELQNHVTVLNSEKEQAESKIQDLAAIAGKELNLTVDPDTVADELSGDPARQEGDLWIDRANGLWVITLGAAHRMQEGQRLVVYDGNNRQGVAVVEKVLDVISYVQPLEDPSLYTKDVYRVISW